MEAINVNAAHREFITKRGMLTLSLRDFIISMVESGQWVEDYGDYYLASEWDAEHKPAPKVTPEVQGLITLARVVKRSAKTPVEKKLAESVYAALRSLDIEPDAL